MLKTLKNDIFESKNVIFHRFQPVSKFSFSNLHSSNHAPYGELGTINIPNSPIPYLRVINVSLTPMVYSKALYSGLVF